MRTDDVLDQIDEALHDNTVSGDAMRSQPAPASLSKREAHAAAAEMMQQFRVALRPMAEAANASLKQLAAALKTLPDGSLNPRTPRRRPGRPAWQSPYGPPRRR